jgi:FAD/FMN-containing dehydrogenase
VLRPSTLDQARAVLADASDRGVPVVARGAGQSYGDAAFLPEAEVLELTRMRRVLQWDPRAGVIDLEPGVTVADLWQYALGDGWWPAVVPGTMRPTVAGCLAMNVHGKNNWARGTLGDSCLELDLLLPDGTHLTVSRNHDPELFHAVIGSFGQLGIITRARLQLKRIHSGRLRVRAVAAANLEQILAAVDDNKDRWEYVVGWIDAFASGRRLGRGLLHYADHLTADEEPIPAQSLRQSAQELPDTLFWVLPKSILWRGLKPFTNRPGMRLVNAIKYVLGATVGNDKEYLQSLAEFSFLLDFVPHWKRIYRPGGLIQHQSFVPRAAAHEVFARILERCQEHRMPSFLAVLKRHRPDPFLLTHAVDGFSLALDFPVVAGRRDQLWALVRSIGELVVAAGGRFYPAKDAALPAELFQATFAAGELDRFARIKARTDPSGVLTSALARRLTPEL